MTTVISLLQPSPEVVSLFDDVMLMADGAIIFHGPVGDAVPFFSSLGFDCPPRKDLASFLQEVSTPTGQLAYASNALREQLGLPARAEAAAGAGDRGLERGSLPQSLLVSMAEIAERFRTENKYGECSMLLVRWLGCVCGGGWVGVA